MPESTSSQPTAGRVILIRHGETDWNLERRSQGWQDQPLNEKGLRQAELMGSYVRDRFNITSLWSSDLLRCMQTAEAIGLPVTPSQTIRELHFGEWEGRIWPELHLEAPELAGKFVSGDPTFQAPGGEQMGNLVERGKTFIEEAELLNGHGDIGVVAHGGSLKGLIVALLGLPTNAMGKFHFSNTSVSVVDAAPGLVRLHSMNDTSHLRDAPPMV